MAKNVVLTGVGHDRVGIVAELAEILFEMGCNLLDSSMTLLRGEFAIILMIRQPEGQSLDDLRKKIADVENRLGLTIHVREIDDDAMEDETVDEPYIISVYGADKPGIVSGVTRVLADIGANVTDVETKHTGERDGAATVFLMVLEVTLPASVSEGKLRATLDDASKRLKVNVSVQSLNVVQL